MNGLLDGLAERQRLAIGTHYELYGSAIEHRKREIHLQRRFLVQPVQLHVSDYADHFVPGNFAVLSTLPQAFPNRVLTWPQTMRQRFINHRNGGGIVHFWFGKSTGRTPRQQPRPT